MVEQNKKSATEREPNMTKLTIGQLITRMPAAQFWGILSGMVALVGGAFYLGFTVKSWDSAGDLSKKDAEIGRLEKKLGDTVDVVKELNFRHKQIESKEDFLSLYYLYGTAKSNVEYIRQEIPKMWAGLDAQLDLDDRDSPGFRTGRDQERTGLSREELHAIHAEYTSHAERRRPVSGGVIHVLQILKKAIDQLQQNEKTEAQCEKGLKEFLEREIETQDYKIRFGDASKGLTGWGVIKFAYDGQEIPIPNEFLPVVLR